MNERIVLLLAAAAIFTVLLLYSVSGIARLLKGKLKWITVYDYQAGLHYRNGVFERILPAGRYRIWTPTTAIEVADLRERLDVVGGQELLTSDSLTVKISMLVRSRISDALKAHTRAANAAYHVYTGGQVVLRKAVAAKTLEQVLSERGEIGAEVLAAMKPVAESVGHELLAIEVRDVMLTGETKRAFGDIFRARKEGEAALERARGETAALRNLANGARMLKDNPALFNLRMLQVLQASAAKGATVVFNASGAPAHVTGGASEPPQNDAPGPDNNGL
jgi:regulator of protease activity HflC (stomatin/prohibitin superfamily)